MRLDQALVEAHLFTSRTKAKQAILDGIIYYHDTCVKKPSEDISDPNALQIRGTKMPYVSRGGLKLKKAIDEFPIDLKGKIVLDIGSSTGGFTDCALQHGSKQIIAIDVGTNQMEATLRQNPHVILYEQTDFRDIDISKIDQATIAVSDVSFISITKMIPKLHQMSKLEQVMVLIKPQFECGPTVATKYHGVPNTRTVHQQVLTHVLSEFRNAGFYIKALTFSPIQGTSGNIEYLALFGITPTHFTPDINTIIDEAFQSLK